MGSSYVKLPAELKSPKIGLIIIKNNDQKCFLWCYVKDINLVKIHPERITWEDKKLSNDLDCDGVDFPSREKELAKLKKRTIFPLTCFAMKTSRPFQFIFQIKTLKTRWTYYSQLMVINGIMYTSKTLTDLCFIKQKIKTKNTFAKVVYSVLVVKMC